MNVNGSRRLFLMSVRESSVSVRGFSMIETMIVIAIIGILVNLAVPVYMESYRRAQVAAIFGDYSVVRSAVADYYLANESWPADADAGVLPPELLSYLGDRVQWSAPFTYDYDYFADSDGNATQPEAGVLVGFSVRNAEPEIVALIEAMDPGSITQTWGNGVTFIIAPTGASQDSESASDPPSEDDSGAEPEDESQDDDNPGRGRGRG